MELIISTFGLLITESTLGLMIEEGEYIVLYYFNPDISNVDNVRLNSTFDFDF